MTQSLKIECLVTDLTLEGEIASFLVTKEQLTAGLSKKADLVDGKIKESNLPDFIANNFQTINQKLVALEESISDGIQSAKDYSEAYTDEKLIVKADLVDGKVPHAQLPSVEQYEGLSEALNGVLGQARRDMIERTDEIQRVKADLGEDGKVVRKQLPNYDKIPGLETVVRDLYDNKVDIAEVFLKSETLDIAGIEATVERIAPTRTEVDTALMMSEVVQVHGFEQKYIDAGGYPFGAVLTLDDGITQVKSTVANNKNNPNSNVVGWIPHGVGKFIAGMSYGLNSEVSLTNGDIVKSTVANNTNNPNVDMMGWDNTSKQAIKFLAAKEIGLVKWVEFKKPPYTTKEYEQAYNNGLNLVAAMKSANDAGYSKVVLERGKYPFCYSNLLGSSLISIMQNSAHAKIDGLKDFEFDGNGSTMFVIFDSNNRNPYDKSTTMQPYELRGAVFGLQNNTNLSIYGFELVGDQYMRSWVAGEQNTEQTYGVFMGVNNINTKIDIVGRGFRGDAVSGTPRGVSINSLDNNWSLGGVNLTTGAEIVEAGSYRSPKIDLQGKTIYRNAVQIYTSGVLRAAEFRNDLLGVFFYDASGNFISTEKTRQCDFIYLPVNCRYIQFVAYEDERTDTVVGYGNYLFLATGSSDIAEVKGEYYANHRGAVSNLCGNTTVDAFIHDNGTTKYGFPHYGDPTRYGVNFEDTFVSKLTVKGTIQNGIQAVLCNARTLNVDATIRNLEFSAIAPYSTFEVNAIGCEIDNVGYVIGAQKTSARKKGRLINFHSNTVKNARIYGDYSDNPDVLLSVKGNTWAHSSAQLVGNGSNIVFDDNTFTSVNGRYIDVMDVRGALSIKGNSIVRSNNVPEASKGWGYIGLAGVNAGLNIISIEQQVQRLISPRVANEVPKMRGVEIIFNGNGANLRPVEKTGTFADHVDNRRIENCVLNGGFLTIGDNANFTSICTSNLVISGGEFKNGFYLANSRRETVTISNDTLLIKNVLIDLTNSTYLLRNIYALTGTLAIQFIDCTFIADAPKSIAFIQGQTANITAVATNCKFINVVNTDTILQISGTVKSTFDPPSLATNAQQSTTVTLTGAKLGDNINVSFDKPLGGTRIWGEVTASNTVTVYHRNGTGATVDVASGTLTVKLV